MTLPYSTPLDQPPPKCPYFTLPDVNYLLPPSPVVQIVQKPKREYVSLVVLWGTAARMTDENMADFLLEILKHSTWEPNFEAVARAWNVKSCESVKRRLSILVESRDYTLEKDYRVTGGNIPDDHIEYAKEKPKNKPPVADGESMKSNRPSEKKKRKSAVHEGDVAVYPLPKKRKPQRKLCEDVEERSS